MKCEFLSQTCLWSVEESLHNWKGACCWTTCISVLSQELCWLPGLCKRQVNTLEQPAGHYFCISHAFEVEFFVCFVVFFFFLLGVLHHNFKLQIRFLRPFDNSEILLLSSCHKSFPYSCEIVLHCKNLWNQWHFPIASVEDQNIF